MSSRQTASGPTTPRPAATPPDADALALRADYVSRRAIEVFDDVAGVEDGLTHQPDVYQLVAYLVERTGARRIVDIGCGSAKQLLALTTAADVIGIDHPSTVRTLQELHPTRSWIAADLEAPLTEPRLAAPELAEDAVVVCSDVIEHLLDPRPLLELLRSWRHSAKAIVMSTPDRVRVRGVDDIGPPANPFHVREWQLDEFDVLLRAA